MAYNNPEYFTNMRQSTPAQRLRAGWSARSSVASGVNCDPTLPMVNELSYNRAPLSANPFIADTVDGWKVTRVFPGYRGNEVRVYSDPLTHEPIYFYGPVERTTV